MAAIYSVQCSKKWINRVSRERKGRRSDRRPLNPDIGCAGLFSRDLARRIERAGIVDLGDLMIAEAEHLAENLVGVFAQ
jgi:2-polyprenyl-3-methyl-5-hydroxy-6-metoxy-1,4-benzoquinol methylase